MTLQLFNVCVIYQINTLGHWILFFFLILESLNEIWASFEIIALRCYNKRQGRKLWPVWRQNTLRKWVKFVQRNSIYSQYFSLDSQFMACSFYPCSQMKYTFSTQWLLKNRFARKRFFNEVILEIFSLSTPDSVFSVLAEQKVEIWLPK